MYVLQGFDPSNSTSKEIDVSNAEVGAKILLYNESPYTLKLDFYNGFTDLVHANEARWWPLDGETPTIGWSIYSTVSFGGQLSISEVTLTLYGAHEEIPGTYPISLTRQIFIGNQVNTIGGTASAVQNDANVAGSSVVEATVSGDGASAVALSNNGHLSLGTATNNGTLNIVGLHGNVGVDANGQMTVDNRINVNLLVAEAANDLAIHVGSGNRIVLSVNGVDIVQINATGISLLVGDLSNAGKFIAANAVPYQAKDSGGTAHDILYVNSVNQLCIQMPNTSQSILLKDASGGNLVRIDGATGNMRVKGTITPSVVP